MQSWSGVQKKHLFHAYSSQSQLLSRSVQCVYSWPPHTFSKKEFSRSQMIKRTRFTFFGVILKFQYFKKQCETLVSEKRGQKITTFYTFQQLWTAQTLIQMLFCCLPDNHRCQTNHFFDRYTLQTWNLKFSIKMRIADRPQTQRCKTNW